MTVSVVRIATRSSPLALWQAHYVRDRLLALYPELKVELLEMKTRGDVMLDTPLAKIGGKGLFVKELETAMLENRADIAVHSMKDVPMEFPPGLTLAVVCEREDPRDAFVSNRVAGFADLPHGAVVGTSSLRRAAQLKAQRPDLNIVSLRGNVQTRLRKLDDGQYDAIILAGAGLIRLALQDRIREFLPTDISLPAVGQGAVGIECRENDAAMQALLAPLNHPETADRVRAERAMNRRLEGGCQVPIAGFAELDGEHLSLRALVASEQGDTIIRTTVSGVRQDAEALGVRAAEQLLANGANAILQALYQNAHD